MPATTVIDSHPPMSDRPAGTAVCGFLYYVMGASGAGKDTLLDYARRYQPQDAPVLFAHRYITRPAPYGSENHVALTPAEFQLRLKNGCFVMHWQSHGYQYGIGIEIVAWLQRGLDVVVSGSREYLPLAQECFPGLIPVLVTAAKEVIAQRLVRRGREDEAAIRGRCARNSRFAGLRSRNIHILRNDGSPEEAGRELISLLTGIIS